MLFWAIVMLLVTCYAFAVIMVVSVGQAEEMKDVVEIQHDWGQLDHAMMVMLLPSSPSYCSVSLNVFL